GSKNHHRTIVDRAVKGRTRQHQAVKECDGHANGNSAGQGARRPARRRAREGKFVAYPPGSGRDDERLSLNAEPDVTDKTFVQNLINQVTVVRAALGQSFQRGSLGSGETFHRDSLLVIFQGEK